MFYRSKQESVNTAQCLQGKQVCLREGHLEFRAVRFLHWYVNFTLGLEQNGSLVNV